MNVLSIDLPQERRFGEIAGNLSLSVQKPSVHTARAILEKDRG
jgi:hypothetical protein